MSALKSLLLGLLGAGAFVEVIAAPGNQFLAAVLAGGAIGTAAANLIASIASRLSQQAEHQVSDDLPDAGDLYLATVLNSPFHFHGLTEGTQHGRS